MKTERKKINNNNKIGLLICLSLITLVFTGCASPGGVRINSANVNDLNNLAKTPQQYTAGSGDVISIRFLYSPEMNNDEVVVSPSGNIILPLIGEVHAEGLTLLELNTILTEKYYKELGYSLDGNYTLGVGDSLSIKLLFNNELDSKVKVRPDGKISLPLIGEIDVAGKTPSQLDGLITELYYKKLGSDERPDITIIVQDFKVPELSISLVRSASQIVYVGGEVNQPKVVNINGPIRVLNAVMMAGGAKKSARLDSVILIRYTDSNTPTAHLLDMNQVLSGKLSDVILKPYDIVYVPQTSIASTDIFMQHIWNIIPVNFVFSFPYNLNTDNTNVTISK